jgi:hypothetical protein
MERRILKMYSKTPYLICFDIKENRLKESYCRNFKTKKEANELYNDLKNIPEIINLRKVYCKK